MYFIKKTIIILVCLVINLASCQEYKQEKMIQQFVIDLFDNTILPTNIVDNYLQIELNDKNNFSIDERKKGAIGLIEKTRKGEGIKGSWLIPNSEIKNIKDLKIYPYNKIKKLNTFKISGIETLKNDIYVLLSPDEKEILQYFLLNKNHNKISSFSLLVKPENQAWFFSY